MSNCPCCTQTIPATVTKVDLDYNVAMAGGHVVSLEPAQAVLLHTLLINAPEVISHAQLSKALYGARTVGIPAPENIRLKMCRINKLIRSLPLRIKNVHGKGWWLEISK